MTHLTLQQALPAEWIDGVFQEHRSRQYPRELLFSSVVELMMLVTLGLRPSLHAAARRMRERLPVSMAALYAKVKRTEPAVLRALVQGSAQRLAPTAAGLASEPSLPGWQLRVFDGNHLPATDKRLGPLRGFRGAALPGHTVVVYDPDTALVCDIVACEDAYESERTGAAELIANARPGQAWIGDRHFCTQTLLLGLHTKGAGFIVREHERHPKLTGREPWSEWAAVETGRAREQAIELAHPAQDGAVLRWRRIEVELTAPTESGDTSIALWSNLPEQVDAASIARLYRKRWRIEGMFQRLESVLQSEVRTLGHPRAALLGFTVAVLAYNVLALLKQVTEQAHQKAHPNLDVSTYHLAVEIAGDYDAMVRLVPSQHLPRVDDPAELLPRLLALAYRLSPKQLATSKRAPKNAAAKGYVDGAIARSHVSTDRVLKAAAKRR